MNLWLVGLEKGIDFYTIYISIAEESGAALLIVEISSSDKALSNYPS